MKGTTVQIRQPLTPAPTAFASIKDGEGPRHIVFSNDKKHVYLVTEMGSAVHVFDYDNGKLKEKQAISILRNGFKGQTAGAAIHISPDGKFLYASNRLETNEISVFSIDQETGGLTLVQHVTSYGKTRAISPLTQQVTFYWSLIKTATIFLFTGLTKTPAGLA